MSSTIVDRIAVVDVETTGLNPYRHDRVLEIAIVICTPQGDILEEFETLINPARDIGPTHLHGVICEDLALAPLFAAVAGDIMARLASAKVLVAHNAVFDFGFLRCEFERCGLSLPELNPLCTYRLSGGGLASCCDEFGIEWAGPAHHAITDARMTAKLLARLLQEEPVILDGHITDQVVWPEISSGQVNFVKRGYASSRPVEPPTFLQRMTARNWHDNEGKLEHELAYLSLLDRVLEDRIIDPSEHDTLFDAATAWRLSPSQIEHVHSQYIHNLVVSALADGIVTERESHDLHLVSRLLGREPAALDSIITSAQKLLASAGEQIRRKEIGGEMTGKKVCFTGEIISFFEGERITRDTAQELARTAGLVIANSVTKALDILVVADPHTQSTKAKKAREYGTRIVYEPSFWQMIGIKVT